MYAYICIYMCIYESKNMCICISYVYVYKYIYIYVCICSYINELYTYIYAYMCLYLLHVYIIHASMNCGCIYEYIYASMEIGNNATTVKALRLVSALQYLNTCVFGKTDL